ncbi:hypothetical protein ACLEPN_11300 [Myxococcus sp. 1LA]
MDKSAFAERLCRAAERTRDFTRTFIIETLPDTIRFDVQLNVSYDGHPLHPDERVYPEDSERIPVTLRSRLTQEDVVELLWRDGAVPEWIDLKVGREDGEHTLIVVSCCGRFTANEQLLYHEHEGYPPFHVHGPSLPPPYERENQARFSFYWQAEARDGRALVRLSERSLHMETLVLSGPDLDDAALEVLPPPPLPALRHLRLDKTRIQGPGLRCFANAVLRSLAWLSDPDLPIDLQSLERFSRLEELEVEGHVSYQGLSSLRGLTSLSLRAPASTDLGALRSLDTLVALDLGGLAGQVTGRARSVPTAGQTRALEYAGVG